MVAAGAGVLLILLAGGVSAYGSGVATTPGATNPVPLAPGMRTITVIGQGRAAGKPDIASAVIGIQTLSKKLREGTEQNSSQMAALVKTLKSGGITEHDIQTTNYSVSPERKYSREGGQGEITGYRIVNQVQVKFRDLGKIGSLLDRVVENGGNTIQSIAFAVDDPTPLRARASASAIAVAHAKAVEMAKAANVSIGEVFQISEVFGEVRPVGMMGADMMGAPARTVGVVPIEAGELEVTAHVQVVYSIR